MSDTFPAWFRPTRESLRELAGETALLEATELVEDCLEHRGIKRSVLADRLGIGRSEITQRLSGKRNLTVKTFASMLHELGYRLAFQVEDVAAGPRHSRTIRMAGSERTEVHYTQTGTPLTLARRSA